MGFANDLLFEVRKSLPALRRKPYEEILKACDPLILDEALKVFGSHSLKCEEKSLRLNLFYLYCLSQIDLPLKSIRRVMDLGSQDFRYALGLSAWLRNLGLGAFYLSGMEMDAHQIYFDLYTRKDVAESFARLSNEFLETKSVVDYQVGDWLQYESPRQIDLIFMFFPFLFKDLHERAGLPSWGFNPEDFYRRAIGKSSNAIVLFHQGEEEKKESLRLLHKMGGGEILQEIRVENNPFMKRKFPTEILIWIKESSEVNQRPL